MSKIRTCQHCGETYESYKTRFGYVNEYCHECTKKKVWIRKTHNPTINHGHIFHTSYTPGCVMCQIKEENAKITA